MFLCTCLNTVASRLLGELSYRMVKKPFIGMGRVFLGSTRLPDTSAGVANSEAT
ncbi:hypothetical protein LMG28727_03753 [Paraburkholderia kirstenboschensis]|nr:hypothetical protein LMG28727_03753 [Paraburkholderia kirstenboschensis]